jgi:hypothetical protein
VNRPAIQVCAYSPKDAEGWDHFVANDSRNGGMFHERRFLSYHPSDRFRDVSLVFRDATGEIVGVLPCAQVRLPDERLCAESHPGSTAGSLVFAKRARLSDVLAMVEAAALHFQATGFTRMGLRVAEPIFAGPTTGEMDFALWHLGFRLRTRELSTAVRLGDETARLAMVRKRAASEERSAVRRGVRITESNDVDAVWRLIAGNLKDRYGKPPTHSLSELAGLKQIYPDRIHFWCATLDDSILAAMAVFDVTPHAAHAFYIAHDRTLADVKPMSLLVSEICASLTARGFSWFNLGISTRGEHVKWGILEFKELVGGRGVCREEWELADLSDFKPYEWPA